MQLSEAIRLGSMLHPQAFGTQTKRLWNGEVIASCALGAARLAGYDDYDTRLDDVGCPACSREGENICGYSYGRAVIDVESMVVHLNDTHHWTREAIADWVETVEQGVTSGEVLCETA